jgi:hypothetical protein
MQVLDQLKAIGYEPFLEPDGTLKLVYRKAGEPDKATVLPLFESLRKEKGRVIQYLRDQAVLCNPDLVIDRLSKLLDRYRDSGRALAETPGWLDELWRLGRLLDLALKTRADCRVVYEAIKQHFDNGVRGFAEEETGIL